VFDNKEKRPGRKRNRASRNIRTRVHISRERPQEERRVTAPPGTTVQPPAVGTAFRVFRGGRSNNEGRPVPLRGGQGEGLQEPTADREMSGPLLCYVEERRKKTNGNNDSFHSLTRHFTSAGGAGGVACLTCGLEGSVILTQANSVTSEPSSIQQQLLLRGVCVGGGGSGVCHRLAKQ